MDYRTIDLATATWLQSAREVLETVHEGIRSVKTSSKALCDAQPPNDDRYEGATGWLPSLHATLGGVDDALTALLRGISLRLDSPRQPPSSAYHH
jgi:hypothetical protein